MGKFKPKCRTCGGTPESGSEFYCWLPSQCKKCRDSFMKKYMKEYYKRRKQNAITATFQA